MRPILRASAPRCFARQQSLAPCRLFTTGTPLREADDTSFKGQLYESTRQRLQRERETQNRFAAHQQQSPGYRYLAITLSFLGASLGCYYLGSSRAAPPSSTSTTPLGSLGPLQHDTSVTNLQAAWSDFVEILGKDNVSTDPNITAVHTTSDWSSYTPKPNEKPFVVVYPGSTEDVSRIMKVCHSRRIPVTPYSGGTSLEGHFAPTNGGACIDFARMGQILAVHPEDLDVVVQPSVGWEGLNDELAQYGLFFPPDPGPGAMIGGMVSTGCSGTNAYRYGTMRDWVLSVTVVLADGTIIKTRQRPRKSSAGYDLTRLFIGNEGTLGLITEASLRLAVRPKSTSVAVASFPTVHAAAACVQNIVRDGLELAGLEILDDTQMRVINESGGTSHAWAEAPTLFLKFAGTPAGVREQVSIVRALASRAGSKEFSFARSDDEARELWSARKEALWSMMSKKEKPEDHLWTTDVAVPISRLPDIIQATKDDIDAYGILAGIVGHVGDGNFHAIIVFPPEKREIVQGVIHRIVKRAVELEGTVTGEHGVGVIKRDYLPHELGEPAVDTMRQIKLALDPLRLLNADKVIRVRAPAPDEVKKW